IRAYTMGSLLAHPGDSGPSAAMAKLTANADLFLRESTLLAPHPEGGTRGHLAADEAVAAFEESGAQRLLLTHRPHERPLDSSLEQVHDGMEVDLAARR